MKYIHIVLLLVTLSLTPVLSNAQSGTIKGFVYDDENGEPISYCMMQLKGTQLGAMTERSGAFIITRIPEGTYVLSVKYFGYTTIEDTIVVGRSTITKRYLLKKSNTMLDEFEVTADAQRRVQETRTSVISITPKEIAKMPSIEDNPTLRNICRYYRCNFNRDQGGQLYVRENTNSRI